MQACERLSKRLEEYKSENVQLEELLAVERRRAAGGAGELSRLEDEAATLQVSGVEYEYAVRFNFSVEFRTGREKNSGIFMGRIDKTTKRWLRNVMFVGVWFGGIGLLQAQMGREMANHQLALDDKDRILTLLEGRLEAAQRAAATAEGKLTAVAADNTALRAGRGTSEQRLTAQLQAAEAAAEATLASERAHLRRTQEEAEARAAEGMAALHEAADQLASHQVRRRSIRHPPYHAPRKGPSRVHCVAPRLSVVAGGLAPPERIGTVAAGPQRLLEDRTEKVSELERRLALSEAECERLQQVRACADVWT